MNHYEEADLRLAAGAAVRAPSLHNSQPWRFRRHDGAIEIIADPERQLTVADPTGWAVRLACGAATYNARLALAVRGRPAEVTLLPDPAESRLRLIEAARGEAAGLDLLVGMTALSGFAEIAQSADRVLRRNHRYQAELITWTRADQAPDGVPAGAGGPLTEPQDLLPQRPFTNRRRAPGHDYEPEPLVGILGSAGDRRADQIAAGQALQKVLLTATDAGLATSMISQPIEVPAARDQLRRALGRSGFPQLALRIGYGTPSHPTRRRALDAVLRSPSDQMQAAFFIPADSSWPSAPSTLTDTTSPV